MTDGRRPSTGASHDAALTARDQPAVQDADGLAAPIPERLRGLAVRRRGAAAAAQLTPAVRSQPCIREVAMAHREPTPRPSGRPRPRTREELAREFMEHRPRLLGIAYRLLGTHGTQTTSSPTPWCAGCAVDRDQIREPRAFLTTDGDTPGARPAAVGSRHPGALRRRVAARAGRHRPVTARPAGHRRTPRVGVVGDAADDGAADAAGAGGLRAARGLRRPPCRDRRRPRHQPGGLASTPPPGASAPRRDAAGASTPSRGTTAACSSGSSAPSRPATSTSAGPPRRDAVAYSDGGGKARAARRPIVGADKVIAFFGALRRRRTDRGGARIEVNGQAGGTALVRPAVPAAHRRSSATARSGRSTRS